MFTEALARISANLARHTKLEQHRSLRIHLIRSLAELKKKDKDLRLVWPDWQFMHKAHEERDATHSRIEELCDTLFCQYDASEQLLENSRARSDALQKALSEMESTAAEVQHGVSCALIVLQLMHMSDRARACMIQHFSFATRWLRTTMESSKNASSSLGRRSTHRRRRTKRRRIWMSRTNHREGIL